MASLKRNVKRRLAARLLHLGCSSMDSIRICGWHELLNDDYGLTDKEYKLVKQRYEKIRECVADLRKIANHLER